MTGDGDERQLHEAEPDEEGAELGERGRPQPRPRLRLRRSPLGVRAVDVRDQLEDIRTELEDCRDDVDELRNDIAALWVAFGQHERAIRDLIAAVEALGGTRVAWPGEPGPGRQLPLETESLPGVPAPAQPPLEPPGRNLERDAIAAQLAGLDDVLAAIDQATRSLESVYRTGGEPPSGPTPERS